ncbi:unnamed protein product, partial [Porites evermanni]
QCDGCLGWGWVWLVGLVAGFLEPLNQGKHLSILANNQQAQERNTGAAMEFKPISQGWRNILNVHTVAIIELQQKFSSQNVFVLNRKVELYSMEWQDAVDLSRFIVSAAPFGGPIALIRDDKHFARVQGSAINKPIIHIFSSAGRELATVKWDGGPIVQMGWSVTEDLLCMADDGTVMVYDIHGAIKKTLSMGQDAKESKVIDCKTYNFAGRTGIAILTSNYHFYVANNVEEVRSRRYYDPPGLDAPPSSWVIMPHDRGSSLLVAIDNLLYLTEKGQCNKLTVSFSAEAPVTSIIEMAISYN